MKKNDVLVKIKKIPFKRDKRNPDLDINHVNLLKTTLNDCFNSCIANGLSFDESKMVVTSALSSRSIELVKLRDSYTVVTKKDTFYQFITNIIELMTSLTEDYIYKKED